MIEKTLEMGQCTICEKETDDRMMTYDSKVHDWIRKEPPEYICEKCLDSCMT